MQTLLDEGVKVTQGGIEKLQGILGRLNEAISRDVAHAPGSIEPASVAQRTADVFRQVTGQVNPISDRSAVQGSAMEFLRHPQFAVPTEVGQRSIETGILDPFGRMVSRSEPIMDQVARPLTIPEAQALKTGTYQQLAGKYGEMGSASTEAQKSLARGLKEEIAAKVPGIADLNAREGNILQAMEPLGRRVAIQGRANPIGFALVAHRPAAFLSGLADKSAAVKSYLAAGAWAAAGRASGVPAQLIRDAAAAVASGVADTTSSPADQSGPRTP